MRKQLTLSISILLLVAATGVATAQTLPRYQATVVGSASFSPSCVVGQINDAGVMAGSCDPYGSYGGGIVVWRNGVATSYGKLPKGTYSRSFAINSLGVVTGEGDTGDGRPHTVLTYKGALLQTKDSGVNDRGVGITDSGVIFGNLVKTFDGGWAPVFWTPEAGKPDRYRVTALPLYNDGGDPRYVAAYLQASNKAGQGVGSVSGTVIGYLGAFWNNDAAHSVVTLSPLPATWHSMAYGINDLGQAVGESDRGTFFEHAVLWQNDATHSVVDLGTLPGDAASTAYFINNAGQIVGYSGAGITAGADASPSRVFFYANGTMAELSSLVDQSNGTWEITSVMSLNNAGQMIAAGRHDGQVTFNILLTPVQ